MEKVYISGKVTGLPWPEVEEKFREAAGIVRHHGGIAIVPIHYCNVEWSWYRCMRVCLSLLLECDKILMLPDWKKSRGAKIEWFIAMVCGIPVLNYKSHDHV